MREGQTERGRERKRDRKGGGGGGGERASFSYVHRTSASTWTEIKYFFRGGEWIFFMFYILFSSFLKFTFFFIKVD